MQGIEFDFHRRERIGLPEAVFCQGKSPEALHGLLTRFAAQGAQPVLFTRLAPERFAACPAPVRAAFDYHEISHTAFNATLTPTRPDSPAVAVVSAGTSDAPVAWEAARTLDYLGIPRRMFEDCGVAGLWRLTQRMEAINQCAVVIAVAGMDAALISVLGGLTSRPVFGVPTSVGYGVAEGGRTALSSMLASCAPGVGVVNIDNGFGAACAAARIINNLP